MRNTYWNKLCNFKYRIKYLTLWYKRCLFINRFVKIGTIIVSSGAIAAWIKLSNFDRLWGLLIVLSQVASSVYGALPYQKRAVSLSTLLGQLEPLYLEIESHWETVDNDESMTDDKISALLYELENRWVSIDNRVMKGDVLPQSKKFEMRAKDETDKYIINVLGGEPINEKTETEK